MIQVLKFRVRDFLDHLERIGKQQASESYYYKFRILANHIGVDIEELSHEQISPLVLAECTSKLEPSTANTLIAAVRSYLKFLKKGAVSDEDYYKYARLYDRLTEVSYRKIPRVITRKGIGLSNLKLCLEEIDYDEHLFASTMVHYYLGSRPVELAYEFEEGRINLKEERKIAERKIDFEQKLIAIITAKTEDERIIPIDNRMVPYFEVWYENLGKVLRCERPREWLTRRLRNKTPIKITAKTARQTLETQMRRRWDQWIVDYWIGHTTKIPDIYTDFVEAIEDIRAEYMPNHYLFDELFMEYF